MTRVWLGLALVAAMACGKGDRAADGEASAGPVELEQEHECAACGMIVAEQPSPRAQLVHRDGTRELLCSIGDLLAYLEAPSPHGAVVHIWVETLDPAADPRAHSVDRRPWRDANSAHYVLGIDKERVMGAPIMAYDTLAEARAVAERYGGRVVDFDGLRAEPTAPPGPRPH